MFVWAVINLAISLLIGLSVKAPLMRAYLAVNYVLILNPVFMWEFFGLAHPKFIPGLECYTDALVFMALFNIGLGLAFYILTAPSRKLNRAPRDAGHHHHNMNNHGGPRIVLIVLGLALLGYFAKFGLEALGALRMGEGTSGDISILQAIKALSGFDLLAIIFLGELRIRLKGGDYLLNAVLVGLLSMSLVWALISGSRAQTVTMLILGMLAYRDLVRRHGLIAFPTLGMLVPTIFLLFPLLGYYRISNYDFTEARRLTDEIGADANAIMTDVLVTRLNYFEALSRAVDHVNHYGPAGGEVYWNNIIGLIPRLVWPDKPRIENNSKELGQQLDLVTLDDTSTSIGLQVVGEAFYELGWAGLWVALFQALLFALIHNNFFRPGNPIAMTTYAYAILYVLQRDGYFAVVPGLIWLAIAVILFFGVLVALRGSPHRLSSYETLPHRRSH